MKSGEKWAAMAGSLAGAIDVAIVHLNNKNVPRALECLREAEANWNKALDNIIGPLRRKEEQPECGKSS